MGHVNSGLLDQSDSGLADGEGIGLSRDMTAINSGLHDVPGVRLPLQTASYASPSPTHTVFMYSGGGSGDGGGGGGGRSSGDSNGVVTLQLREADGTTGATDEAEDDEDEDEGKGGGLASVLARLQQEDATLSISYQDGDVLAEGSIDVLLGSSALHAAGGGGAFDLFDSESGQDLTLSPQTFTSSTEAFLNDNSESLPGAPGDADTVGSSEEVRAATTAIVAADSAKLAVKKSRPKASSPNRQGPQQCQVCGKVFGNASALAKHKLTHSDERKYVCSMCGKAFKRQDHLNGHMLTHRNKKPFECKAEGCGKSYCDARSLRRHTENHHTTPAPSSGSSGGRAEEATSCIQYAPPPPYPATASSPPAGTAASPSSQLQQLLASPAATGAASPTSPSSNQACSPGSGDGSAAAAGSGAASDGLTRQLELIQQIMQQTQQQAAAAAAAAAKSGTTTEKGTKGRGGAWSSQQGSGANKGASSGAAAGGAGAAKPADPKPVECNLCHRKFKNIPALNGHMRLHGGYFKKDSESKKSDKKDCGGPPLQTASVSVRALIEEKIIQKRITNPALAAQVAQHQALQQQQNTFQQQAAATTAAATNGTTTTSTDTTASSFATTSQQAPPPQYPGTPPGSGGNSKTGFAIPAAPSPVPPPEKTRRHSDSAEHFAQPPRSDPVNVKRVQRQSSEPTNSGVGSPLALALAAELAAAEQAGANANSYGLAAAFASAGAGAGFFHQDDVFQQVPEAVLQLAESIQFQAEEMAALEEFHEAANSPSGGGGFSTGGAGGADGSNADFPPLQPVTLADLAAFSAAAAAAAHKEAATVFAYSPSSHHKETATVYAYSPQPQNHRITCLQSKDATGYTFSPHTASPLPSPLQAHDSPSFAYPTPPASQEGPSFGLLQQAPLGSPHASAADSTFTFYAGALSPSAAAVEAALNEVLPGESLSRPHHTLLYHSAPAVPSPPPSGAVNSPLSATPVPSPLSSVPASSSSAPSPLPPTSASNNQYSLQSQMMPNSDDPLLSSSPKDFGGRKRFDFGVFRNGSVDTTSATLHSLGLVVDSSGELRFYPTSGAASPAVTSTTNQPQHRGNNGGCNNNQRGPLEAEDDVFLSPTSVPASPIPRLKRPRPRPEPLYIPTPHQPPPGPALYPSRMRPSRMRPCAGSGAGQPCSNVHFTPQPMLDPARQGQGLYNCLQVKNEPNSSGGVDETMMDTDTVDVVPHINVGSRHQVTCLPMCEPRQELAQLEPNKEHLLWDPGISAGEGEIDMYLEFACCAAVPGGGRNKEYALHLLHMCHGNIHEAMLKLMQPTPALPAGHPLLSYCYSDSARWAADEVEAFQQALVRHGKDFRNVSKEVSTKSEAQCVQFYYLWKKVCPEEYQRLRLLRQRPDLCILKGIDLDELANDRLSFQASDAEVISSTCTADTRLFMCEYPDCSASFNSRAALNGHVRIHGGGGRRSPTPDGCRGRPLSGTPPIEGGEEFPCKVCGKVFGKVKSRSAHMKSHRPPDAEPKRPKNDHQQQQQQQQQQQSLREDCRGAPSGMMSTNLPVGLGLMQ